MTDRLDAERDRTLLKYQSTERREETARLKIDDDQLRAPSHIHVKCSLCQFNSLRACPTLAGTAHIKGRAQRVRVCAQERQTFACARRGDKHLLRGGTEKDEQTTHSGCVVPACYFFIYFFGCVFFLYAWSWSWSSSSLRIRAALSFTSQPPHSSITHIPYPLRRNDESSSSGCSVPPGTPCHTRSCCGDGTPNELRPPHVNHR